MQEQVNIYEQVGLRFMKLQMKDEIESLKHLFTPKKKKKNHF